MAAILSRLQCANRVVSSRKWMCHWAGSPLDRMMACRLLGTIPSFELMPTYLQLDHIEHISFTSHALYILCQTRTETVCVSFAFTYNSCSPVYAAWGTPPPPPPPPPPPHTHTHTPPPPPTYYHIALYWYYWAGTRYDLKVTAVTVGREKNGVVPSFCYLGDCSSSVGDCELDVITRRRVYISMQARPRPPTID